MPGLATQPARTILSLGLVFGLMACAPPHMNFSDVSLPGSGKPEPKPRPPARRVRSPSRPFVMRNCPAGKKTTWRPA